MKLVHLEASLAFGDNGNFVCLDISAVNKKSAEALHQFYQLLNAYRQKLVISKENLESIKPSLTFVITI